MNTDARENILTRLKRAAEKADTATQTTCLPIRHTEPAARTAQLKRLLEAVRTEVHVVERERWTETLKDVLIKRDIMTLLYAPQATIGPAIEKAWQDGGGRGLPKLCVYGAAIEEFKEELFQIDAAITTSVGAIAESGAEAWEELRRDDSTGLEEKYGSGDASVDDEVAALMAKVKGEPAD